jgi:IS4 transposase
MRHRRDEQVKFRVLVNSKEKVRGKKSLVYFARANLDLPKREVLDLYNKERDPIGTSYGNIKAFLPFTSSTKFIFRTLIFVLALVLYLYTIFKGEVGREEFRLLLILLFPDLFNPENFTFN